MTIDVKTLLADGDLFGRVGADIAGISRAALAADAAFSSVYVPKSLTAWAIKDMDSIIRSAGDLTLNNAAWTDVPSLGDLTVTATTGDIILVNPVGLWGSENVLTSLDCATIVSAAPVNYVSTRSGTPAALGVGSWFGDNNTAGVNMVIGGPVQYPVQAGDVSGGTVTLRLRYDQASAANRTLFASTANVPLMLQATVYTPVS